MKIDKCFEKKGEMELLFSMEEISWTDETYRQFGIPDGGALTLHSFLSYVHDDDREITRRAIMLCVENKVSNIFNFRFIRPDTGEELFIHSVWEIENSSSGEAAKMKGTLLDMTKRGIAA